MKKRKQTIIAGGLGALLMATIIFCTAQSTQQRVMTTTSAFWRQMLTNETGTAVLAALAAGTNNFPYESLVGGLNLANQFLATDGSTNLVSTVNGGSLTNLNYRYPTNAIPNTGLLTIGSQLYTTNLTQDTTFPAPFIASSNLAYYVSSVLQATNGDSATHKVTLTGVTGPLGVCPAILFCTNGHQTKIIIDYGNGYTNAWKIDF